MTDTHNFEGGFDAEERRQQIIAAFEAMDQDKANKQLAILPYYHQLENEITKPNQGVYVTRYFLTKWQPALGSEASSLVLALRLLADKDGRTFASIETIAQYSGMSIRSLKRWISDNEQAIQPCSPERVEQWRTLHTYFLRSKSSRYLLKKDPTKGAIVRRTTSLYEVAMDDPVHQDDQPKLFALAAERMVNEELVKHANSLKNRDIHHKGQIGPKGPRRSITIETDADPAVENSGHKGQIGLHVAGPNWPSRSLSDRMNVTNVYRTPTKTGSRARLLTHDPRVAGLTPEERTERERMVDLVGETLKKLQHNHSPEPHRNAGFHRRVALLMNPTLVHEALAATQDAVQRERSGELKFRKDADAYFGATVIAIAEREGIDLGLGKRGVAGQIEPLAVPRNAPTAALPATTGAQMEDTEDSSPEARARIYADHLFAWRYSQENDGRNPSEAEKQAAYEQRLEELTRGRRTTT